MSQQTMRQQARRTAREMGEKRRRERARREGRTIDLVAQVLVAVGERDAAVAEAEKRAGAALRKLTEVEGLSLGEAVKWCGDAVTVREATRLRRLAGEGQPDNDQDDDGSATVPATVEGGGAGSGTTTR